MIAGTVGQGGANAPADVTDVQTLLNAKANAGLTVDGICGPLTIAAITAFQSGLPGIARPDGVVAPDGPTYAALSAGPGAGAAAAPSRVQPVYAQPTALVVDLSGNNSDNPPVDFGALKAAGVAAVLLKATEGATWQDPTFAARLARARAAGLLVGAYHFGTAAAVADQVDNFVKTVADAGGDFTSVAAALDVEPNPEDAKHPELPPNTISLAVAEAWVGAFKAKARATPFIYGGADYLGAHGGATGSPNMAACPLWIPAYPNDAAFRPASLPGWADWTLWQFTDGTDGWYSAPVAGLVSDRSVFRGAAADLAALWGRLCAP
jgi:lysozyme